jgi:hypothetical protein
MMQAVLIAIVLVVGILIGMVISTRIQVRVLETRGDLEAVLDSLMRELQQLPHAARQRAMSRIWGQDIGRNTLLRVWPPRARQERPN